MEARQTLSGSAVPKGLIAVLAISVAMALAVAGAIVAKDFAGSGASTISGHFYPAPGTVLRQDNPPQAAPVYPAPGTVLRQDFPVQTATAPAGTHVGRSSGTQSVEGGSAPTTIATSPASNFDQKPGFRD